MTNLTQIAKFQHNKKGMKKELLTHIWYRIKK